MKKLCYIVLSICLFAGCDRPAGMVEIGSDLYLPTDVPTEMPEVNVRDFGALGDGITDDRMALQRALNVGAGRVLVPNGIYLVGQGAGFWCLNVPAGAVLEGESRDGSVLKQAVVPGSVRLLEVTGANVTIRSLTLDGNRTAQAPDSHRAGVFASAPTGRVENLVLEDVQAQNFTGDGLYLFLNVFNVRLTRVVARDNDRDGFAAGGTVTGLLVEDSVFSGNKAQQFDSEPGVGGYVRDVIIRNSTVDAAGASGDYVLTVSGGSPSSRSSGWVVESSDIRGPVNVVWTDGTVFRGNTITNGTIKEALHVYRADAGFEAYDNTIANTLPGAPAVYLAGTGSGSAPSGVRLHGNTITAVPGPRSYTVRADGLVDLVLEDNVLTGAPLALIATNRDPAFSFQSAKIVHNTFIRAGTPGLAVGGNGPARLDVLEIGHNTFDPTSCPAMNLDADRAHAAKDIRLVGTTLAANCLQELAGTPTGALQSWGARWVQ